LCWSRRCSCLGVLCGYAGDLPRRLFQSERRLRCDEAGFIKEKNPSPEPRRPGPAAGGNSEQRQGPTAFRASSAPRPSAVRAPPPHPFSSPPGPFLKPWRAPKSETGNRPFFRALKVSIGAAPRLKIRQAPNEPRRGGGLEPRRRGHGLQGGGSRRTGGGPGDEATAFKEEDQGGREEASSPGDEAPATRPRPSRRRRPRAPATRPRPSR